jgi:hypothetical protein
MKTLLRFENFFVNADILLSGGGNLFRGFFLEVMFTNAGRSVDFGIKLTR